jgi:hypothetical protein
VVEFGDRLHLRVSDADSVLSWLPAELGARRVEVGRLRPIRPSIEDVFISLIAGTERQAA